MAPAALTIWQFTDGKRGHERQSEGLIRAFADHCAITACTLDVRVSAWPALALLGGRFAPASALPPPHLIIGAGRACQAPMLAARWRYGGATVCLMRPQLPRRLFDVCVIARHDETPAHPRTILTDGPLNPMRPASARDPALGLILIGGPSRHHDWDNAAMITQIKSIVSADRERRWTVADSRRTPDSFGPQLLAASLPGVDYQAVGATSPGWLGPVLARAAVAWVSADSVAMIYDALSAGATVGVLSVPVRRADRVSRIAPALIERGWVRSLGSGPGHTAAPPLNEAARVASELLTRLPLLRSARA